MRRLSLLAQGLAGLTLAIVSCEPAKAPIDNAAAGGAQPVAHVDACRDDIPDCAAACALRETSRRDFLDFYDRRCAAVILGKNPDKVEPAVGLTHVTVNESAPLATAAAASSSGAAFPPDVRASLMVSRPAFDPAAVTRTGGAEPPECKAARILRASHREREAEMMDAMCVAKGGDAGT